LAQKIISIIRYLAAEHDVPYGGDEMLFEILHFDWFHIPAVEIAKLSVENSEKRYDEKLRCGDYCMKSPSQYQKICLVLQFMKD
jgi:hypothetical protein